MANIFVIDDESILLNLISTTLRLDGHLVTAFVDPLSAFECAGNLPIDLLVTDVEMKPINGFELVKRLTQSGFTGPVIFMSGYTYPSEAITSKIEKSSVIEKPFTSAQLRAAVGKALAKTSSPA